MIYTFSYLLISIPFFLNLKKNLNINKFSFLYLLCFVAFAYDTGGDSFIYREKFETDFSNIGLSYLLRSIFLFFDYTNLDFLTFKIIISFIFIHSYFTFISRFKDFYFFLPLLFPIYILIYAMGYLKQGLVLSFFLYFLSFEKSKFKYCFLILSLFSHQTGIYLIILYFISIFTLRKKNLDLFRKKKQFLFYIFLFLLLLILFLINDIDNLKLYYLNYTQTFATIETGGVVIRSFFYLIAAIYFIKNTYKILYAADTQKFFFFISWLIILMYPFSFFYPTVIDRIYIYFSPIQFLSINIFLNNLRNYNYKKFIKYLIYSIYFFYFLVWSIYSNNFKYWSNYKLFFFE